MNLVSVLCADQATAVGYVADVGAGELLGVDMGTTSQAINVGAFLLIRCTPTRANKLFLLFEDIQGLGIIDPAPTPATMDFGDMTFYALGMMDA